MPSWKTETQPSVFQDGKDTQGAPLLGLLANDSFLDLNLTGNINAVDYNFGEFGLHSPFISKALLLASTPPPRQLLSIRAADAKGVYVVQTALRGELTIRGEGEASVSALELYDADMQPAALGGEGDEVALHADSAAGYLLLVPPGHSAYDYAIAFDPSWNTNKHNALDSNLDNTVAAWFR